MENRLGSGIGESIRRTTLLAWDLVSGISYSWFVDRLSGYLLFPFLLVTMHLAGGHADWVRMKTTGTERLWIYAILPVIAFIGVAARLRYVLSVSVVNSERVLP